MMKNTSIYAMVAPVFARTGRCRWPSRIASLVLALISPCVVACTTSNINDIGIFTTANDAKLAKGDGEIDSDDYTEILISYSITHDDRRVWLVLAWVAQELNHDRTQGDTAFLTNRQITLIELPVGGCKISAVEGVQLSDTSRYHYEGQVHALVPFPSFGALKNILVKFDQPGRNDLAAQELRAAVSGFTLRLRN